MKLKKNTILYLIAFFVSFFGIMLVKQCMKEKPFYIAAPND